MPRPEDRSELLRPVQIQTWARLAAGTLGAAGVGAGGAAVFVTQVEAGPVALIAAGVLFTFIALSGVMPTRLKIGDNEAEWRQEVAESAASIQRQVPEVGDLLDSGGASPEAILAGTAPESGPILMQAGVRIGSLAEEVRFLEQKAGQAAVPPAALLEIGRWYLAQRDWATASEYLAAYTERADADWSAYSMLGVAYANRREGERTDRAALRAYDEALTRLPGDPAADLTSRLYAYRAGIKKRLRRLREAKIDADIALKLADAPYERIDATYNLACIEAMQGNRAAALGHVAELKQLGAAGLVLAHLDDYFSSLRDDREFQGLIR